MTFSVDVDLQRGAHETRAWACCTRDGCGGGGGDRAVDAVDRDRVVRCALRETSASERHGVAALDGAESRTDRGQISGERGLVSDLGGQLRLAAAQGERRRTSVRCAGVIDSFHSSELDLVDDACGAAVAEEPVVPVPWVA